MIDLSIFADEDRRRELITRYWKLNASGNDFAEPMKQIKKEFGFSRGAILGIVRSGSRAVSKIHVCKCGHRKEFDSRKDFRSTPTQKPYVCEACREDRSDGGQAPEHADGGASGLESAEPGGSPSAEEGSLVEEPVFEKPMDDLFGPAGSDANFEKRAPALSGKEDLSGKEEKRLWQRLRRLARGLSRASQKLERLSHQINDSHQ